ncbi:MAG: APC family permease, partial [Gammaproteobacteria bacterium]
VSIGVGGMVGGGIFAVLGLAVQLSGGGTALAFALAGLIALLTAYSYARLSVALPSQGGTVTFLNTAFGTGVFTGSLNVLLWLSYIVMLSLYAYAFGSYGATFFPAASQVFWKHALIGASVLAVAGLNLLKATLIGEAEDWIVGMKVVILLVFIAVGLGSIDPGRLAPATWSPAITLAAGGMVIFVAYEGFELIANTAHDVRNPASTLPKAYFSAVGFVVALYMLVAVVTVGNLPLAKNVRLARRTGSRAWVSGTAAAACLAALGTLLEETAQYYCTAPAVGGPGHAGAGVRHRTGLSPVERPGRQCGAFRIGNSCHETLIERPSFL